LAETEVENGATEQALSTLPQYVLFPLSSLHILSAASLSPRFRSSKSPFRVCWNLLHASDDPMASSETYNDMSDEFGRLRWSIFDDVSKIRVEDDPDNIDTELLPFWDHAVASKAATEYPLHEISFSISDADEFDSDGFEAPEPRVVRRVDGGVITIADVVEQLSQYLIENKDKILEAKAADLHWSHWVDGERVGDVGTPECDYDDPPSSDRRVAFEGFFGGVQSRNTVVPVELWGDGQEEKSLEYFWKSRANPEEFPI
jgi:hypothetical protein